MNTWKISIDTGGTFTDCLASDPSGKMHRVKVLSNGRLRGRILGTINRNQIEIEQNWDLRQDIIKGYRFEILGKKYFTSEVIAFDNDNSILSISDELDEPVAGKYFEIYANEEAPVLAARIVTQTCRNESLPSLEIRLGSTKGTNALLERKGTKPVLLITKGFGDLPLIGTQQREHLFRLNIRKSEPLFKKVIEVKERIGANGEIDESLTESEINKVLRIIYRSESKVIVIALLNSYKNPLHEKIFLHLFRTKGYKYVCASHQLGQMISFLPRLQTSLVNSYLMPVISDYLSNIIDNLDNKSSLKLMTSSGGLINAIDFQPKDSLLSGPAGGVIGMASLAKKYGITKLLSFDMGGTSTDVSRYTGKFDYIFRTRVGDQTINAPALYIETVAAGGGSVCSYDGFKFSAGPESAGAFPGPACYGAGGALTITDVNLLLGRMYPGNFGIPVNSKYARERLSEMKSSHESLQKLPDHEILQGFFDIAIEKMAKTIEKISVARGYDPAEYTLLAFGGAGGLHACKIAESLTIKKIIVPYDAGILSAVGISHARVERIIHRQVLNSFNDAKSGLNVLIDEMGYEADQLLFNDGLASEDISSYQVFLYLRFHGQDDTIEIPYDQEINVHAKFKEAYTALYGHYIQDRDVELESVKMIVSGKIEDIKKIPLSKKEYEPKPVSIQKSFCEGRWLDTPVYNIDQLREGAYFSGPAVVLYRTSTAYIDKDWYCIVNTNLDIIILRSEEDQMLQTVQDERPEQVQLELFTNRFRSITEEMGALLQRTAFSVNIKERLDFSCALLDDKGYLVVNAPHIPVHLGALGLCTRKIIESFELNEGDIILTNHPAYGGSHLPDVTMIAPVFQKGRIICFIANRAHHGEIGGISPGSMPADAIHLEEEGVAIPPVYIARNGNLDFSDIESLLTHSKYPTRAFNENMADIQASVASIRRGVTLMLQLCSEYGADNISHYMHALHQYANNCIQQKLKEILDTDVEAIEKLDDGSVLKVRISKYKNAYLFDFTGTSPQHPKNMNATPAIVNSIVLYVLRLLIDDDIPLNEGILENIKILLPHCLLNPEFDADPSKCPAVVGGNVEVSQRLVDTILKAFDIVACSQGTMNNLLFGDEQFGYYETICGGVGAGEGFNGASAVHQHMTNTRVTDPEIMEHRYPVRIDKFAIRENSGGKGKWNGGDGVERQIRFLKPVKLTILSQHRKERPYGRKKGEPGKSGEQWIVRTNGKKDLIAGICTVKINPGEAILIKTPGGGAFGELLIR